MPVRQAIANPPVHSRVRFKFVFLRLYWLNNTLDEGHGWQHDRDDERHARRLTRRFTTADGRCSTSKERKEGGQFPRLPYQAGAGGGDIPQFYLCTVQYSFGINASTIGERRLFAGGKVAVRV